jgi:1-acyl-sn-glycerol-3-phosphate acyltransferase
MNHILRYIFFVFIVRPLILLIMGVNAWNREKLISSQPAIIVANHNSHLDTMVLVSLFPLRLLKKIRPVAAMDYFMKTGFRSWFSQKIIGIIPVPREISMHQQDPLSSCSQALERNEVLIFFPEGSRGEPEQMASFKTGIAHLAKRHPDIPIIPVFMYGLGKSLPRGDHLLVPFFCDVAVGDHLFWSGSRPEFMLALENSMKKLAAEVNGRSFE